jgi:RND family efflux transporter MFP subunit
VDDALFGVLSAGDRVEVAKAQMSKVRAMLKETRIVAPFDGVITHKAGEIGQMTQPGEPLFVLEDQSRLKFKTTVKEQDIPHIAIGKSASIIVSALGDLKLEGKVSRIIPSGDPITHSFLVEIALPEQDGLYPGMFGKAEFTE